MRNFRRPAGVDPSQLRERTPTVRDILEAEAEAIGRRASAKILARFGDEGIDLTEARKAMGEIVEAEVRSSLGTPEPGEIVVRFSYAEAVQAATAIVEADSEALAASERDILAILRQKFFSSIGIGV